MAKLIAQSGHSLDIPQRRVTLGESPSCDVPLATGMGLAPVHFEMVPDHMGNWVLRDLSGGNLKVNGNSVTEQRLAHGNVIMAGALQLGFWNEGAPAASPSPFVSPVRTAEPEAMAPPVAIPAPVPVVPTPVAMFVPAPETPVQMQAVPVALPPVAGQLPPLPPVAAVPPPPPAPAVPVADGPPLAWLSLADESKTAPPPVAPVQPADPEAAAARGGAAPAPVTMPRGKRWRGARPSLFNRLPRPLVALLALALLGGIGAGLLRVPAIAAAVQPLWAKFNSWTNPESNPKPAAQAGNAPAAPGVKPAPVEEDVSVTPRAPHGDVVKVFLNERVTTLFQADLRQLIPYYNANATARNLPPQKEMTEAFRKHYGVLLDGFDRMTCVRAPGRDEFVFILTGSNRIDLESMIGLPPGQNAAKPAAAKSGHGKTVRIFPVKAAGRVYGIAQYDPFTVVLGNSTWIDTAINGSSGLSLREALCMFPETASRKPGALIIVERLPVASPDTGVVSPFQVAISNLFLKDTGESRLSLTRNPEVKEEVFVEQSSAALKEQARAMLQGLKVTSPNVRSQPPRDSNAVDPDEIITVSEASIIIPDGDSFIREAIDSVARTFMSQSPSMELILAAQTSVLRFNQARLQGSAEAENATSVAEALELLQNGIVIKGTGNVRDLELRIERLEPDQIDIVTHLLALEPRIGLVFRPDKDSLSGTLLELAVKARDYRNAELLISLWASAKFGGGDAVDARTAVRRVLEWANKDGHRKRISVGLPVLSDNELAAATDLLALQSGILTWKPGEEGYRTWLRKVNPDPKTDAKRIAAAFQQAQKAGTIPSGSIAELSDAIRVINRSMLAGSRGPVQPGGYSNEELRAAARYLHWDGGNLRVIER